MIVIC